MSATQADADLIAWDVIERTVRQLLGTDGLTRHGLHLLRRRLIGPEWTDVEGIEPRRLLLAADVTAALEAAYGARGGTLPVLPVVPDDASTA